MTILITVLSFVFGTAIGSFCNVVIYRLHSGDSPLRGRSFCPSCKHTLEANDLVPILSFLMLRGKCRYCKARISLQYPLVELASGIITLLMVLQFGISVAALLGMILGAFLVVIFVYDLKHELILDRVSIPAMAVAIAASLALHRTFTSVVLGGILGAGFFLLQYLISRGKWIGGGDIRLGAVLGLALGWPLILVSLVIAYLTGAIAAIVLIAAKKRSMSSMVPFGTFLSLAGVITFLWGSAILQWYQHGGFFDWVVNNILRYYNP
ncbi:MAG: prepilin peptidase [Candidatus Kerfeldbacteria bacterium]